MLDAWLDAADTPEPPKPTGFVPKAVPRGTAKGGRPANAAPKPARGPRPPREDDAPKEKPKPSPDKTRNCNLCAMSTGWAVGGTGPKDAKLIVISDYPGAEEEKTNKNMTGPAGLFLRELIKTFIGIDPETEVYYLNAIRCRPGSHKLTDKELAICRNLLVGDLRGLEGRVVLVAGRRALHSMFMHHKATFKKESTFEVAKLRRQVYVEGNRKILVTWNPAYVKEMLIKHPLTGKPWNPKGGVPALYVEDLKGVKEVLYEEYPELYLREEE